MDGSVVVVAAAAPAPRRSFGCLARRAWLGGAVAALVALTVGLHGRAPVGHRGRGHDAITIAAEPASTFGSRQSSCREAWEPEGTDTE